MIIRECPHCGKPIMKGRSSPDHRRFFAVIKHAFQQWPENHRFQPDDAEHLRAWLTCRAGYRESTPIILPDGADETMQLVFLLGIESALRAADSVAFVLAHGNGVAVITPKSIAFDKLGQRDFAAVRTAVEDTIAAEIGITADELLKHGEAA